MVDFPCYPKVGDWVGTALVKVCLEGYESFILVGLRKTVDGLRVDTPFRWTSSIFHVDGLKFEKQ